jgi:hypothetical protein
VFYSNVWSVTIDISDEAVSSYIFGFLLQTHALLPDSARHGTLQPTQTCEYFTCHTDVLIVAAVLQLASGFLYYFAALYAVGHSHYGHCHFVYLTLCFKNSLSYVFMFFVIVVLMYFLNFHLFTA